VRARFSLNYVMLIAIAHKRMLHYTIHMPAFSFIFKLPSLGGDLCNGAVLLYASLYANQYANYANYVVLLSVANAYAFHWCPRCFLQHEKLYPREIYASDGGLITRGAHKNVL